MSVAFDPIARLSAELALPASGVGAVVELSDAGATVPFIARYRKERTGGLDEVQIRTILERHEYLLELEERRAVVQSSIEEQGKLSPELRDRVLAAATKAELEDLYLPFKPKRKTRASKARAAGLQPLADRILAQPQDAEPQAEAAGYVDLEKGIVDAEAALAGARDIVAELVAEHPDARARGRQMFAEEGRLIVETIGDRSRERTKYEQYYGHDEAVKEIPSHRYLAIRRGEAEGVLRAHVEVDEERLLSITQSLMKLSARSPFAPHLAAAIGDGYRRLLAPSLENDVRIELKARSDRAAVEVFAENLRNLLLQSPLGEKPVVGVDPGLRTGCKCAAVDATGRFLGVNRFFTTRGEAAASQERAGIAAFVRGHCAVAVGIGNGTGSREAEALVREALREASLTNVIVVSVNEAGASVYSASDTAREEFPDLDVTVRGAISIARRLQDPLAELVKIEPKAIGVGQYQHDVHQPLLARKLGEVVESSVNHVGVALNTASASLLTHVAGMSPSLAKKVVAHRDRHGAFRSRADLLAVSGLGPRTFEQAAGFLRVRGGSEPLDASAVHPERYPLVQRIAGDLRVPITELCGNAELVRRIDIARYLGEGVGEPTLRDILSELEKPGRDPRADFEAPRFRDDVRELEDLRPGMQLEGVVTNVTAFGAFVDVGVHQDGLVHISELSERFVKDPAEVVKVGQRIRVRVLEVDLARRRVSLSAKLAAGRGSPKPSGAGRKKGGDGSKSGGAGTDNLRPSGGDLRHNPFSKLKRP
jgi:uncharacterized protein